MNNLSTPSNYQTAPIASINQMGGRGHNHKSGCKCPLCKKGGRGHNHKSGCKCPLCKKSGGTYEDDDDIETGFSKSKEVDKNEVKNTNQNTETSDFNFANDDDYDDLDKAEMGLAGPSVKVGGSRKRKYGKKTRKSKKSRKTRRHRRKSTNRKR